MIPSFSIFSFIQQAKSHILFEIPKHSISHTSTSRLSSTAQTICNGTALQKHASATAHPLTWMSILLPASAVPHMIPIAFSATLLTVWFVTATFYRKMSNVLPANRKIHIVWAVIHTDCATNAMLPLGSIALVSARAVQLSGVLYVNTALIINAIIASVPTK